jgi:hypothetical protein
MVRVSEGLEMVMSTGTASNLNEFCWWEGSAVW